MAAGIVPNEGEIQLLSDLLGAGENWLSPMPDDHQRNAERGRYGGDVDGGRGVVHRLRPQDAHPHRIGLDVGDARHGGPDRRVERRGRRGAIGVQRGPAPDLDG